MEKFELLKAIIYQLICENKLVMKEIENFKKQGKTFVRIDISYLKESCYISPIKTIKLGNNIAVGTKYLLSLIERYFLNVSPLASGI